MTNAERDQRVYRDFTRFMDSLEMLPQEEQIRHVGRLIHAISRAHARNNPGDLNSRRNFLQQLQSGIEQDLRFIRDDLESVYSELKQQS